MYQIISMYQIKLTRDTGKFSFLLSRITIVPQVPATDENFFSKIHLQKLNLFISNWMYIFTFMPEQIIDDFYRQWTYLCGSI